MKFEVLDKGSKPVETEPVLETWLEAGSGVLSLYIRQKGTSKDQFLLCIDHAGISRDYIPPDFGFARDTDGYIALDE